MFGQKSKLYGIIFWGLIAFFGYVLFAPTPAFAATFSVNSTGDGSDASAGDGSCATSGAVCTLRAAIEEVNALSGTDTINFGISGSGVQTITPATALPAITTRVTIDGSTQSGASCGTLVPTTLPSSNTPHNLNIAINVSGLSGSGGISLTGSTASNSMIRGLAISHTPGGAPIALDSSASDITIECNYIGTNSGGTTTASSSGNAINLGGSVSGVTIQNNLLAGASNGIGGQGQEITVQNNLIGTNASGTGALPNANRGVSLFSLTQALISHNVIAGNSSDGLFANGDTFTITGNYLGVSVTGSPLGNGGNGIEVYSGNQFTIGGTTSSVRNVISANTENGIHIFSDCGGGSVYDSTIFGNYIGTNTSGNVSSNFGNQKAGIEVNEFQDSCGSIYRHQIGGDNSGEANIIAGNEQQGVLVHQDASHDVFGIAVIHNKIFDNGQIGIDLAADSSSDSGEADTDLGPNPINEILITYPSDNSNNYLNRPTINSANFSSGKLSVNYDFDANTVQDSDDGISLLTRDLVGYRLDFYVNDSATDGAFEGYSQSKTHLGSFIVNGPAIGATHTFDLSSFTSGQTITATATLLWTNTPTDGNVERPCGGFERLGEGPPYYQESCPL